MKFITIVNPDGIFVRINIAHIIFYSQYNLSVAGPNGMMGTRIVLTGHNDEIQFSQEPVDMIDNLIKQETE